MPFLRQPALATVLALGFGILLGRFLPVPPVTWAFVCVPAPVLAYFALRRGRAGAAVGLLAALGLWVLLGAANYTFRARVRSADDVSSLVRDEPRLVRLRGVLVSAPSIRVVSSTLGSAADLRSVYRSSADLRLEARTGAVPGVWLPASGRVHLTVPDRLEGVGVGDRVEVTGRLRPLRPASNPGQFDWAAQQQRGGVSATLYLRSAGNLHLVEPGSWLPRRLLQRTQVRLADAVMDRFGGSAPLLLSLLLGERGFLTSETRRQLVTTGTMHFLAISGLHVGIVASAVWWLLRLLSAPRKRSAVIVFGAVVLYVLLTGARPGALRAAVMCGVLCGGVVLARPVAVVNSIAFAALVILAARPAQLFDSGFQLSFVAVVGIVAFFPPIQRGLRRLLLPRSDVLRLTPTGRARIAVTRWVTALVAVGAAAWLTVAPLLALYFHVLTPYAVPLSVIFFPVVSATVLLGFVYLLLSLVGPMAAAPVAPLVAAPAWLLRGLLALAARLPGTVVHLAPPGAAFLICYYGLAAALRWKWWGSAREGLPRDARRAPGRRDAGAVTGYRLLVVGLLVSAVFIVRPVVGRRPDRLAVTVFDVGHGLATLVQLPNGATLLYDAGGGGAAYDVGANVIAPALWEMGVPRIDALVLSHYHWDHVSGVPSLLERFPVRRCFVNRFFGDAPLGAAVLTALEDRDVPVQRVASGDGIALDERVTIRVLNPPRGKVGDLLSANEGSIALLIEYGEQRVLLLADITDAWLGRVLEQVGGSVDVVQVPHHGLPDVDLEELVRRTLPGCALISAAAGERQEAARETLERAGVTTLTTWEHGAATVTLDGVAAHISTFRMGRLPMPADAEEPALAPEEQPAP